MEKRNFVTPIRTPDGVDIAEDLIKESADLFGGGTKKTASEFEKKAMSEDEKSDSI